MADTEYSVTVTAINGVSPLVQDLTTTSATEPLQISTLAASESAGQTSVLVGVIVCVILVVIIVPVIFFIAWVNNILTLWKGAAVIDETLRKWKSTIMP